MRITHVTSALIALTIGAAAVAVAQATHGAKMPTQHGQMSHASRGPSTPTATKTTFKGIAAKLGTTPDALESAYTAAKQANPKLTRGQFVAANVLAKNLGDKNPAITTQAILDGLQSGKSVGQTLQGLGMKDSDADKAEKAAEREIRAANRGGKSTKSAAKPDSTKMH
jgi:predicted amino acid dehydrogenase